ncbi:MAG: hypothetical protein FWD39_01960 [Clostridiales bacterium]|nr:hypothetical protein [Clostridiales bacterium]
MYNLTGELNDEGAAAAANDSPYSAQEAPGEDYITPEMAASVLKMPFSVASVYLGAHWELSDGEAKLMATQAARLFSRLAGRFAESNPDAFVLGLALAICVGPRAVQTVNLLKAEKAAKDRAARVGAADPARREEGGATGPSLEGVQYL